MNGESKPTILVIERNERNLELLIEFLNRLGYNTIPVSKLSNLDEVIEADIQLALLDITGFGSSIWECCEKIRTRGIQLLIVSQKQSMELTKESRKHGASGVLIKPLVMKELSVLIQGLLQGE